ncbi:histidine kinase dimerization/phospho-acceptor domain-containing protein [Marivirga sp.]|uniref:histidine kinase dimerization/phospho-acceptor domain-containing protein n=1 Tax=Marivirga sp. TaxID=2018662 RepID=UPI0025DEC7E3|nr:histidine kinase dimerization/phospho-acceptor domain-containing protein [Marivirga sp.]
MTEISLIFFNKYRDFFISLIFGLLSSVLGLITIDTPGFEGSYSDLREVALLIAIFHLRNPLYIILLCVLTLIGLPFELRLFPIFLMHAIPLFILWYSYQWIKKFDLTAVNLGIIWFVNSLIYYCILLYPMLILSYWLFGYNQDLAFLPSYKSIFISGTLEMMATAFVSSIYLVQMDYRRKLENNNKNLERIVNQRTEELSKTNNELIELNSNLENIVEERTQIVQEQLKRITKYVHMNSHEVRAPLARILGLLQLIKKETSEENKKNMLDLILVSSKELDVIVKKMNRILEVEQKDIN